MNAMKIGAYEPKQYAYWPSDWASEIFKRFGIDSYSEYKKLLERGLCEGYISKRKYDVVIAKIGSEGFSDSKKITEVAKQFNLSMARITQIVEKVFHIITYSSFL